MKCEYCGSNIEAGLKYCKKCGSPVSANKDSTHQENGETSNIPISVVEELRSRKNQDTTTDENNDSPHPSRENSNESTPPRFHKKDETGQKENRKNKIKENAKFFFLAVAKYLAILALLFVLIVVLEVAKAPGSFINNFTINQATNLFVAAVVASIPFVILTTIFTFRGSEYRTTLKNKIYKKPWFGKAGAAATALLAILFVFQPCPHNNCADATCTTPERCYDCGKTWGEINPDNHSWIKATCKQAEHCSRCEKEVGDPLPHSWIDATCTQAKHCTVCGLEEGEKAPHDWIEATCTQARHCSVCGETQGSVLPHTPGEFERTSVDYVKGTESEKQTCQVCGADLGSSTKDIESFVDGKTFSIPAGDFVKRISNAYSSISGCSLKAESGTMNNGVTMSLDIKSGTQKVAAAGFVEAGSKDSLISLAMSGSENRYWQVMFAFANSNNSSDYAAETMYAAIQACDPSLTQDEAHAVGNEVINNFKTISGSKGIGQASKNGITYMLSNQKGWSISARIPQE